MASDTSSKPNIPAIPRSQAVKQYIEPSYSTLLQLQNDMAPGRQQKKQQLQQLQTLRESKYTNKRTIQKWRHQIWVVPCLIKLVPYVFFCIFWPANGCWAPHMLVKIMLFCCFSFVLHFIYLFIYVIFRASGKTCALEQGCQKSPCFALVLQANFGELGSRLEVHPRGDYQSSNI